MDVPAAEHESSIVDLVKALDHSKGTTLTVILTVIVGYGIWRLLIQRNTRLEKAAKSKAADDLVEREQEAKNLRAAQYTTALNNLATATATQAKSHDSLSGAFKAHADEEAKTMEAVHKTLNTVSSYIGDLVARQAGFIPMEASIQFVEKYFTTDFQHEVYSVFEFSLKRNDYKANAENIRRRVKTQISKAVTGLKNSLKIYRFSFNQSSYFPTDPATTVVRYVICDNLWNEIEPLYANHKTDVNDRIAEMQVRVDNVIRDYLDTCREKAKDFYAEQDVDPTLPQPAYKRQRADPGTPPFTAV